MGGSLHRLAAFRQQAKTKIGSQADTPYDPHRVITESRGRASPQAFIFQILGAAQRVVQTVVGQVNGNGVECEITPEQVGFQVGAAESREIQ